MAGSVTATPAQNTVSNDAVDVEIEATLEANGVDTETATVTITDPADNEVVNDSNNVTCDGSAKVSGTVEIPATKAAKAGEYKVKVATSANSETATFTLSYDEATGAWDTYGFNFSDEDAVIGLNQTYLLLNVTNPYDGDKVVDPTTYKVFYFNADDGTPVNPINSNTPGETKYGTHPKTDKAGEYYVAVVNSETAKVAETTTLDALRATAPTHVQKFTVKQDAEALGAVTAYEYDTSKTDIDDQNTADSDFVYTGEDVTVGLAIDGKALEGAELSLAWTAAPEGVDVSALPAFKDGKIVLDAGSDQVAAGIYRANVTGVAPLNGSATVEFTIDPLDLSEMTLTAADVLTANSTPVYAKSSNFKVDGKAIADGIFNVSKPLYTAVDGTVSNTEPNMAKAGSYAYTLTAPAGSKNVTGSQVVTVKAFEKAPTEYKYGSNATLLDDGSDFATFVTSFGEAFNPALINVDGKFSGFEVTVTKGGVATEDYSQPGQYSVTVKVSTDDYSYGGSITDTFSVKASNFNPADCEAYIAVDGKVNPGSVSYDGQAHPVTAVVKDADGNTLAEGEDYELVLENAKGEAIESAVDVAKGYKAYVAFPGFDKEYGVITFEITKATVLQVRPTADFFATDGETAAVPSFEGSTADPAEGEKFESGDVFALAAGEISVSYKTATWADNDNDGSVDAGELTPGDAVDASDLTKAGWYQATITVLNSSATLQGKDVECFFQVKETAGYADVPADAWYAESVYKAKDNGFMSGVASGIFAPERTMTRAEFAQTVYNMAHEAGEQGPNNAWETYPTQFADVASNAWYAKAVEWAARYGIVTGKSATEFDPYGTVTREEIAVMLYRYIGNGAKADASVLDRFEDKAEVCDWAVDAMAWAVEEGVVNGVSETSLAPHGDAQRCMIAAMAVRAQPERIESM